MNGSSSEAGPSSIPREIVEPRVEVVGGPFAVVESDPGVFTSLIRKLGIKGVEVEEVYDIQPWALDQLKPKGLILCFSWQHDKHHARDFLDPAAQQVWFANQLSDDACSSLAILNVLFNCPDVDLGEDLAAFKSETAEMSSVMKGLAMSNFRRLCDAQNSLARPADIRGALAAIAEATRDADKASKAAEKRPQKKLKPSGRRGGKLSSPGRPKKTTKATNTETEPDSFHFVGYVPAYGKVWELDGLKAGPLEVGELDAATGTEGWENIVRPALRLKMAKYGKENIQFNLLALVGDRYESKSDELEMLKRERAAIERRLDASPDKDWRKDVDSDLADNVEDVFSTSVQPYANGPTFTKDFGKKKQDRHVKVLQMAENELKGAWEACVTLAMPKKIAVEDEVQKAVSSRTEAMKRTYDYDPFISQFITALNDEGLLARLLPQKKKPVKNGVKAV